MLCARTAACGCESVMKRVKILGLCHEKSRALGCKGTASVSVDIDGIQTSGYCEAVQARFSSEPVTDVRHHS